MAARAAEGGAPCPLGVNWIEAEQTFRFALFSRNATAVKLLFFGESATGETLHTCPLTRLESEQGVVWHCRIPASDLEGIEYYGYQVEGPAGGGPGGWHHFDSEKVLVDPYARAVFFPPGFDRRAAQGPGSNLGRAPLGVLLRPAAPFDWGDDRPPRHDSDLIVYELHPRGFTRHPSSGVSPDRRGTLEGLGEKIDYLKELDVTAVELMPTFQFDPQEKNFWGYMPVNFFAVHGRYASASQPREQIDEFRRLVKALHAADIEVILDVVYNHTGEGHDDGPLYSLKGIDNSTYYLSSDDPERRYLDFSGTGNTLNCSNPATRQLLLESMRYWVREMHVDGFRFDLASALARGPDGSIEKHPVIFEEVAADPVLQGVRLIAEPWDAAGAYQLGADFPGRSWMQWNDKFRDDLRRFVRGDTDMVGRVMSRIYGSSDLFSEDEAAACRPCQSVNYIASHDGFTLYDLVSYNEKHNLPNGQGGRDGHDQNFSWNCGVEGDDGLTAPIMELRKQQAKNFCCLLLLSNGTPMIRAGDEFLQTQGGNNNPYNQDNETSWLDWNRLDEHRDIFRFFRSMIAFRKLHPSIGRQRFWHEDVRWFGVSQKLDMSFHSRSFAYFLRGTSTDPTDLYVLVNAFTEDLDFEVQVGHASEWRRVIDTAAQSPDDFHEDGILLKEDDRRVRSRSVVVLTRG
ncbi:MAG: isoamylase [Planctomycetota bacterium]|nr:isoamylase [Planctomycetota bacterium]